MSHQVLARKWRPQSFKELVGQQHVLQALTNALEQGRLHHAYLLTGTRGVGKTTIARILARCFNCEQGVTAEPCGRCASCCEIAEGRSIDLIEVDAASRTKVEDTRELLDNVQFAPTQACYKIYLIDEVHMLSNSSFNALLKTLEEPPPHVIFLLATTHPQKIPPTVLSRCLQFHLKNLPAETIVEHLTGVLTAEQIAYEEEGLWAIAHAAAGSMRDALSLTEQAISFGAGQIQARQVNDMLGVVDHQVLVNLCTAIVESNAEMAMAVVKDYAQQATDFLRLIDDMLALFHRTAVEQVVPGAGSEGEFHRETIAAFAQSIAPEDIQLFYQVLIGAKRDMSYAPDPLTGLEMLVLRLLAFRRLSNDQAELQPSQDSEVKPAKKSWPEAALPVDEPVAASTQNCASVEPAERQSAADVARQNLPPQEAAETTESSATIPKQVLAESDAPDINELTPQKWCEIFSGLPLSGVVRAIAAHCVPLGVQGEPAGTLHFAIKSDDAVLYKDEHSERLSACLSIYFSQPVVVAIQLVDQWQDCGLDAAIETPLAYKERREQEKHQATLLAVQKDQNVQALIDAFDGQLEESSVTPIEKGQNAS